MVNEKFEHRDNVQTINIYYTNINGLNINKIKNSDMIKDINEMDIICFTETHLNETNVISLDQYNEIATYSKIHNNLGRQIKGVSLYYKNSENGLKFDTILSKNGDTLIIKITNLQWKEIKELFLILCYRESRESKYADKKYFSKIKDVILKYKMKNIILLGDLNSRISTLNDNEHLTLPMRQSEDNIINKQGRELINFCNDTSLIIANGRFEKGSHTYVRYQNGKPYTSVIDYLIISESMIEQLKAFEIIEPKLFTDHRPMKIEFEIKLKSSSYKTLKKHLKVTNNRKIQPFKWSSKYETSEFKNDLLVKSSNLIRKIEEKQINKNEIYKEIIKNNREIFTKDSINEVQTIYSKETREMRKTYKTMVEKYKKEQTTENLNSLLKSKKLLNVALKKEKVNIKKLQIQELQEARHANDHKTYWQILNKNKPKTCKKMKVNLSATSFKENIEKIDKNFKNINLKHAKYSIKTSFLMENSDDSLEKIFTTTEIEDAIQTTKNAKSSGPDKIVYEMFKDNQNQIKILEYLFNDIFTKQDTPWNTSWIMPIFKKGNQNDANSYRYLNLASCIEKLLTKILNNRLNTWLEKYRIIHESQIGFRKGHSTIDNIWILKEIIQIYKNDIKPLYICFIDLSKAFDSIPKSILINKLRNIIPSGKFLSLIENMLYNKRYKVLHNGQESDEFRLTNGIPQGDSLSPTLFCIYMNDYLKTLDNNMNEIDPIKMMDLKLASLIYADDIVLLSESQEGIIKQINITAKFCEENGLDMNYKKTKLMINNERKKYKQLKLRYPNQIITIDIVEEYKYLGIWIAKNDRKHIEDIIKSGKASSYLTAKTLKNFTNVDGKTLTESFEMLTLSKMKYASELYFDKNLKDVNRVIMQFFKKFYHLRITTPNYCIIGEFGIKPIEFYCYQSAMNYYVKLNTNNETHLTTRIFRIINSNLDRKSFRNTWCERINNLFKKTNSQDIRDIRFNDRNPKMLIHSILIDYFRKDWINSAKGSEKGLQYLELCRFRCDLKLYLTRADDKTRITEILKLRTGNHNLAAETGTYQNRKTFKDCICKHCDSDENEDIFHFIAKCPRYYIERNRLIPFMNNCSRTDFYEVIDDLNAGRIRSLDKFIDTAMTIRRTDTCEVNSCHSD